MSNDNPMVPVPLQWLIAIHRLLTKYSVRRGRGRGACAAGDNAMKTKTLKKIVLAELAREIRNLLLDLPSNEARLAAISLMTDGICTECGQVVMGRRCSCRDNE